MFPENYNFYGFLVDVVIPIGIFIIGLLVERKWKVTEKIFQIHDESKTEQSQNVGGNDNKMIQARDIYGNISIASGAENTPERLPYKENQFIENVIKILDSKNISSTFADCYRDGYKHLRNRCSPLAASSYLSAFLQVKDVFLTKINYRCEVNENLIKVLENNFDSLQQFSDKSTDDMEKLQTIIRNIENTMISLLGYFNL